VDTLVFGALCTALSAAGIFLTTRRARSRGRRWTLRMLGLSLLPFGLWATGIGRLAWRLLDASVDFFVGLTFNPLVWVGFGVLAASAGLLVLSWRTGSSTPKGSPATPAVGSAPARDRKAIEAPAESIEGMDEIEAILRRRGIS